MFVSSPITWKLSIQECCLDVRLSVRYVFLTDLQFHRSSFLNDTQGKKSQIFGQYISATVQENHSYFGALPRASECPDVKDYK